jgi:uncharacterized membrane protein YgcG
MKLSAVVVAAIGCWLALAVPVLGAPPAGPPYPDAVPGQRVYDYAGIFSPATEGEAEGIIADIDRRTGAQVAVYTQVKPQSESLARVNADAAALMNQWGVGRKGFDDGLVILFDMQANLQHGQVSLYAGSGYRAAYLSDAERQGIFDTRMKPFLAAGDMDGGLLAGLREIAARTRVLPPAGPPYPDAVAGQRVYDYAEIFAPETVSKAERVIAGIEHRTGAQVAVYTQVKPESDSREEADADALALMNQWGVGRKGVNDGLVILFDMHDNLQLGQVSLYFGSGYQAPFLSDGEHRSIVDDDMEPLLSVGDMDGALLMALRRIAAPPPGPSFPDAVAGQTVYDFAGIFSVATVAEAERIVSGIEERTGAQVRVYTQVKPESDSRERAGDDAQALMDQWGVGRKGFDDGLVILFDMQANLEKGVVSLYAGSGYRAAFLTDDERQAIFDRDMEPLLSAAYMDDALLVSLREVDASATPEHAGRLQQARQINALLAVGGILICVVLIGWIVVTWMRGGRDPFVIDDSSILMPAPPEGLTPAMATVLLTDRTSDRTVSAGLVDLSARGAIAFEVEKGAVGEYAGIGIRYLSDGDRVSDAEARLLRAIESHANYDQYVSPDDLWNLREAFGAFRGNLERGAVRRGWLKAVPSSVTVFWSVIGGIEIATSLVAGFLWLLLQASGLLVLVLGLALAGAVTLALARAMPSRTRQGAMLYAMLAAYRRTLRLSMTQARSMGEVVDAHALPWVTAPDQVMAWSIAFGLSDELRLLLERSKAEATGADGSVLRSRRRSGRKVAQSAGEEGNGMGLAGTVDSSSPHGLYSATAIPDPGSIVAALGSIIHASPPYSGGGGGGGGSSSGGASSGGSFDSGTSSSGDSSSSFGGGSSSGGGGAGGGF